ncbi:hypothetical protein FDO65_05165 [Nakamurella flava]|uniref:PQQ-like beta-propeller repeat protein n=1 Tax=Nakamurella flava TaxID=2576308 RepID=A0A4U6QLN4_9ACTN|nr:hypothetical protein [Nakamurella flava]TKV61038.1 hypothetical protein FDO65_05165 [Nakamurella flava]
MSVTGGRRIDPARQSPIARRRRDRIIAAGIAVVVLVAGLLIYLTSDGRATTDATGPAVPAPSTAAAPPAALAERWTLTTDPALGAVASPYGVVVTADTTTVYGHDATTGALRWSYGRSNLPLCAVGSGDVDAPGVTRRGVVRGVMVVSEEGGWCSQVMLLDPDTGERHYVRTSPDQPGGALVFGGPYAGWVGPTLTELWRDDLVRTIQYGDEPAPTKPNAQRLGCVFTDLAVADRQFATVEHCTDSTYAQVVINWADPGSAPDKPADQDVFKHTPRATIDTGAQFARIVGITADSVAVLLPKSDGAEVVVYDTSGQVQSRADVTVPAAAIATADRLVDGRVVPTPAVRAGAQRYSLIGSSLLEVTTASSQRTAPATSTSPAGTLTPAPGSTVPTSEALAPSTVTVSDLQAGWVHADVTGLPAVYPDQLLVPVAAGLQPVTRSDGLDDPSRPLLSVDRGGWAGRVDVSAVGDVVVETRGDQVVGLS